MLWKLLCLVRLIVFSLLFLLSKFYYFRLIINRIILFVNILILKIKKIML
nr:MAG TPA: hypothetical protein [Caudoviricetes sp.]